MLHRETRPEFVPAGGRPSSPSGHMIIHARINLVGYQTGVSVLNDLRLRIYHRPGFLPGISGKEYSLDAMYVRPLIDGDGELLKAVECYLRVPESEVRGGFGRVEIQTRMDLDGDQSLMIPSSSVASESAWRWSEDGFSNTRWDSVVRTSDAPTTQPKEF